jgi:integrase
VYPKPEGNIKREEPQKQTDTHASVSVLAEMKKYNVYRVKERDKLADAWEGGERFFMFTHAIGRPFIQEQPYYWLQRFTKHKALRTIRFHDLRHTSATLLINQDYLGAAYQWPCSPYR